MIEFLYNQYEIWIGAAITLVVELVLFFIGFFFNRDDKKIVKKIVLAGIFVLVAGATLTIVSGAIKSKNTVVPNVKNHTRQQAIQVISDADIIIDINDFYFQRESLPIEDAGYVVEVTEPAVGSLIEKGSSILCHMVKLEEIISPISISTTESSDIKKTVYNNVDESYLYPFNAQGFTLSIHVKSLEILTENPERSRDLGSEPILGALVRLYDYSTNILIEERQSDHIGVVRFENLKNGIYYYQVLFDGYKDVVPQQPFKLLYNPDKELNELPWAVDLEKVESSSSHPFKVKLVDKLGEPIKHKRVEIRTVNSNYNGYSSLPMHSDANGYLTLWHAINDKDFYELASFKLWAEYVLEIYADDVSVSINASGNLSEYTIVFE